MTKPTDITSYYAQRATEYEKVYAKPERQQELATLRELLPRWFAGHSVLEVACGTGYWTEAISKTAQSIVATDINDEVLEIARRKKCGQCSVEFRKADAYSLDGIEGGYSAGFAGFWWSHIPKSRRRPFLQAFHAKLACGALVVLLENSYVHGSNSPLAPTADEEGNTYSLRRLEDGSEWRVLKNFPTEAELRADLYPFATDIEYGGLRYYWWVKYFTPRLSPPHCQFPLGRRPPGRS
jgi:demethylmenaquinone methyltransferase/2-methoxy-6-polyprenyl-1,4-benzoquinol methylase